MGSTLTTFTAVNANSCNKHGANFKKTWNDGLPRKLRLAVNGFLSSRHGWYVPFTCLMACPAKLGSFVKDVLAASREAFCPRRTSQEHQNRYSQLFTHAHPPNPHPAFALYLPPSYSDPITLHLSPCVLQERHNRDFWPGGATTSGFWEPDQIAAGTGKLRPASQHP